MRVAVLSMTRDRLAYTQHCFARLHELAGCEYDHYVLDQGSSDGTSEWLFDWAREIRPRQRFLRMMDVNIGICRALNKLLGMLNGEYDVIVRFDNDCEVLQPDTLKTVAEVADEYGLIVAPRILGLRQPPATLRVLKAGEYLLDETAILGGIFMAIPAFLFDTFRYDETQPPWAGDELICPWYRQQDGHCGYLQGFAANHYLTTDGQADDERSYHERKLREMAA